MADKPEYPLDIQYLTTACADQVSIAIDIVNATDAGPELVLPRPWRGIRGLFAGIGAIPSIRYHNFSGVRGVLDDVVELIHPA